MREGEGNCSYVHDCRHGIGFIFKKFSTHKVQCRIICFVNYVRHTWQTAYIGLKTDHKKSQLDRKSNSWGAPHTRPQPSTALTALFLVSQCAHEMYIWNITVEYNGKNITTFWNTSENTLSSNIIRAISSQFCSRWFIATSPQTLPALHADFTIQTTFLRKFVDSALCTKTCVYSLHKFWLQIAEHSSVGLDLWCHRRPMNNKPVNTCH